MKYLFVCTGNTCRSPMACGMYNARAKFSGLEPAESGGITASQEGEAPSIYAIRAAARYGADISGHRAHTVTEEQLASADAVVCMSYGHITALTKAFPGYKEKYRIIMPGGIFDPYGGDINAYLSCAAQIDTALKSLVSEVEAKKDK